MGNVPEVLIGENDRLEYPFSIAHTVAEVEALTLDPNNLVIHFIGDESLASRLIGWGILRTIVSGGRQAVLLVKDGTDLKLPGD